MKGKEYLSISDYSCWGRVDKERENKRCLYGRSETLFLFRDLVIDRGSENWNKINTFPKFLAKMTQVI